MNPISIKPPGGVGLPELESLARSTSVSDQDKIAEVSRQFEAYLLREYLGEARKTLVDSRYNLEAGMQSVYSDMITTQLADSISKTDTVGLGGLLREQLIRQNLKAAEAPPGTRPAVTEKPE